MRGLGPILYAFPCQGRGEADAPEACVCILPPPVHGTTLGIAQGRNFINCLPIL